MKSSKVIVILLIVNAFIFQSCGPNTKKSRIHLENGIDLLFNAQHTRALEELNLAIKYDPESFEAYYYRGAAHQNLQNIDGALADFNQSIEINPAYAEPYFSIAQIYDHRNDKETACFYYLKAEELGMPNIGDYTRWCK